MKKQIDFPLDGWEYDNPEALKSWMQEFSKSNNSEDFLSALKEGGGKALGLKICEVLADSFNSEGLEFTIEVPKWKVLEVEMTTENLKDLVGNIIRSSTSSEDWINAGSGEHTSYPLESSYDIYNPEIGHDYDGCYISQEIASGHGLVVDIGNSTCLDAPVVKIASGITRFISENRKRPYYTSATADSDGPVGVYDIDGNNLIRNSVSEATSFFSGLDEESIGVFVKHLAEVISSIGINFGVQLEFRVDPEDKKRLKLVQIRPTPGQMLQSTIEEKDSNEDEKFTKVIAQSGVFNTIFSSIGNGEAVSDAEDLSYARWYEGVQRMDRGSGVAILNGRYGEQEDWPFNLPVGASQNAHFGLWDRGYDGVITPMSMNPLFRHDKLSEDADKSINPISDFLSQNLPMIQLSLDDINGIAKMCLEKEIQIRSDGIIAQVRISE